MRIAIFVLTLLFTIGIEGKIQNAGEQILPLQPVNADSVQVEDFFWYGQLQDVSKRFPTMKADYWGVTKKDMKKTGKRVSAWADRLNETHLEGYSFSDKEERGKLLSSIEMLKESANLGLCTGESKYLDMVERTLYNGICGYQHSEDKEEASIAAKEILGVPSYAFSVSGCHLYVNIFVRSSLHVKNDKMDVRMMITSSNPWFDQAMMQFVFPKGDQHMVLHLKTPGWLQPEVLPGYEFSKTEAKFDVVLNGKIVQPKREKGYLVFDRVWNDSDFVQVLFPTPIRRVKTKADPSKVALQKGVLLYQFLTAGDTLTINTGSPIHSEFDKKRHTNVLSGGNAEQGWKAEPLLFTRRKTGSKLFVPYK